MVADDIAVPLMMLLTNLKAPKKHNFRLEPALSLLVSSNTPARFDR